MRIAALLTLTLMPSLAWTAVSPSGYPSGTFSVDVGKNVAGWVQNAGSATISGESIPDRSGVGTKSLLATDAIGDARDYAVEPGKLSASVLAASEQRLRLELSTDPKNPAPHARLGRFFLAQVNGAKDHGTQYAAASSALLELERTRALTNNDADKLRLMVGLVRASYIVDRLDKARDYAIEWMKKVPAGTPDYGNAQHYGHTALGLIALKAKDVKRAKDELALSADHQGSPQLNSFGPCMDLAAALVAQGQGDAVADYLEACGTFWKSGQQELAEWRKVLAAGNRPDFSKHFSF